MKHLFLGLLVGSLMLCAQSLTAQEVTVTWSEDLSFGKNITVEQFVGLQDGEMFLQTHKNEAGVKLNFDGLQRSFKKTHNIGSINTKIFSAAEQGSVAVEDKGATLLGMILTTDKKWFFAKSNAEKSDVTKIKAYQLDNNMKVNGTPIVLHSFTEGLSKAVDFYYKNTENDAPTELILSEDSTKIALFVRMGEHVLCKVFDATNMKLIWERQTKIVTKKSFSISKTLLTNEGKLYIVGKTFNYGKERFTTFQNVKTYYRPVENEEAMFFCISSAQKNISTQSLGLENAELTSAYIGVLENGNIAVIMSYFLAPKKGFAYYEINDEEKVVNNFDINPDPKKIKNLYKHAYDMMHKGVLSNTYSIQKAIFKADGSMLLNLEFCMNTTSPEQEVYRNYDDILMSVNSKGAVLWATANPRGNVVTNHRLRGLQTMYYKNSMYYIYIDTKKNIQQDVSKSVAYPSMFSPNYYTAIAKIDANGVLTRRILDENNKYLFLSTCSTTLSESGEFICLTETKVGELGAKYKLARVKITD